MQPGTERKPAAACSLALQPSNLEGTLSHQEAPPGPPEIAHMSLRRKDSSTAFLSHWLTVQDSGPCPPARFSATRALPESSRLSAASTASRRSPFVAGVTLALSSKAASIMPASCSCAMVKCPPDGSPINLALVSTGRRPMSSRALSAVNPGRGVRQVFDNPTKAFALVSCFLEDFLNAPTGKHVSRERKSLGRSGSRSTRAGD